MNGPEGGIFDKTYHSIKLLDWGLNHLRSIVFHHGDFDVNLQSCMTLELKHLDSTVNHKQGFQTMLQYACSFSASVSESIKFLTN